MDDALKNKLKEMMGYLNKSNNMSKEDKDAIIAATKEGDDEKARQIITKGMNPKKIAILETMNKENPGTNFNKQFCIDGSNLAISLLEHGYESKPGLEKLLISKGDVEILFTPISIMERKSLKDSCYHDFAKKEIANDLQYLMKIKNKNIKREIAVKDVSSAHYAILSYENSKEFRADLEKMDEQDILFYT